MEDSIISQELIEAFRTIAEMNNARFRQVKTMLAGFIATQERDLAYMDEYMDALFDFMDPMSDTEMLKKNGCGNSGQDWLESEEARRLLGVSPKTWQNYRDQRLIHFSQIGRKIYVNRTDLDTFLRSHRIMDGPHPAVVNMDGRHPAVVNMDGPHPAVKISSPQIV